MRTFLLITFSLCCAAVLAQSKISGTISPEDGGKILLKYWQDFDFVTDTIPVDKQNHFEKTYAFTKPVRMSLRISKTGSSSPFFLVLPHEALELIKTPVGLKFNGSVAEYNAFAIQTGQHLPVSFSKMAGNNANTQAVLDQSDTFFKKFTHPQASDIRKLTTAYLICQFKFYPFLVRYNNDPAVIGRLKGILKDQSLGSHESDEVYKYLNEIDFNNALVCADDGVLTTVNNFIRICRSLQFKGDSTLKDIDPYLIDCKLIKEIFHGKVMESALLAYNLYHRIEDYTEYPGQLSGVDVYIDELTNERGVQQYLPAIKRIYAQKKQHKGTLEKGATAPRFTLQDRTGKTVSLTDFRDKVVYLDLWATWCSPCLAETPHLNALREKYKGKKLEIISISLDTDKKKWLRKMAEPTFIGWQLIDSVGSFKSKTATDYNLSAVPAFVLIDKKGKIVSPFAPRPSQVIAISRQIDELLKESK